MRALIEAGAAVDCQSGSNETPLCIAARDGHETVVRVLVIEGNAAVNQADRDGATPLWIAAKNGHEAAVRFLVTEGNAAVNQAARQSQTPLCVAAQEGHEAVVRFLVAEGNAAVNQADSDGATPLCVAAQEGHEAVVRFLTTEGNAAVDQATSTGHTPLYIAAKNGHEAAVRFLVTEGNAAIDQANNNGVTPLHIAAHQGHAAVAMLLAALGADLAVRLHGRTAEDRARGRGHPGLAAFLGAVAGWQGFKIAVACRLADAASSFLRHGRIDPSGSCSLAELAAVAGSPAGALWLGSPAACEATAALSKAAMVHWAPSRHFLFQPGVRSNVLVVFQVRERLGRQPRPPGAAALPELPLLTWYLVCSFFLRRSWPVP